MVADVPRTKLSELVGQFGPGLSRDARQCKALLADVCGNQYRGECAVLVAAVEEGVAGDLSNTSGGVPIEVLLGRLSDRLQADRGISPDLARWSVECWAVALGVSAGGSTLTKFKMQGLVPLIELAGADGRISEAQLIHLIAEAKARGVSETDASAYLSAYAARREWQLDGPQPASGWVGAKAPQPMPSPAPQPPRQAAPARRLRWVAAGLVGLMAIPVIVVAMRPNQQFQPLVRPPTEPTAPVPSPPPVPDTTQQRPQELADPEQRTYNAARGNLAALRTYVNTCTVCAFRGAARAEIAALEAAQPKPETVSPTPRAREPLAATLDASVCGRSINYTINKGEAFTGLDEAKIETGFLGVWTGNWKNSGKLCGALIVKDIDVNGMRPTSGSAEVIYINGPSQPNNNIIWKSQYRTAYYESDALTFTDDEGSVYEFHHAEYDKHYLNATFEGRSGKLSAKFQQIPPDYKASFNVWKSGH